jgi:hypothetical protein
VKVEVNAGEATPWCPAVEDLQGVPQRIASAEQRVTAAEFALTQDQIVAKVSSSTKYKMDLWYGRNFILDSADEIHFVRSFSGASNTIQRVLSTDALAVTGATNLRLSFDVKLQGVGTVNANTLFIGVTYSAGATQPTRGYYWQAPSANMDWTRVTLGEMVLTSFDPTSLDYLYLGCYDTLAGSNIWVKNIKLESGSEWTPWSAAYEDAAMLSERMNSAELKISDDAIISTVTQSTQYANDKQNLQTQINQNANSLSLTASDVSSLQGRVASAESSLTIQAGQISSKVSVGGIISAINQSAERIEIEASRISLNGVVTANEYFRIYSDGSMQCVNGTFSGTLDAASGTFKGNLTADTCYFKNLQAQSASGSIKIGNWSFVQNGLEYTNGYFDIEYSGGTAKIAGTAPMSVGPYTNNVMNPLTLYGTQINVISNNTAQNMRFWVPGTQQLSLTPVVAGNCNIGTSAYPFDVVYARSVHQTSLRKGKKNIRQIKRGVKEGGYTSIMDFEPVMFEMDRAKGSYLGLIAEDVEKVCPGICSYDSETGELGGIQYGSLAVVCLKELQDLVVRVEQLEQKESRRNGKR